jgi:hypothetical protein
VAATVASAAMVIVTTTVDIVDIVVNIFGTAINVIAFVLTLKSKQNRF